MDNDIAKKLAKRLLEDSEGYSPEVYKDSRNIDTVGTGNSLRSPATIEALTKLGKDVEAVKSGKEKLTPKEIKFIDNSNLNTKTNLVGNLQKLNFPEANLNEAQKAALISLAYNNPKLIGSGLSSKLNENDEIEAMKEIALKNNRKKEPGVAYRRLQEAELFGGPLGFQQMIDSMSEEEKNIINNTLRETKDPQRRKLFLDKYPQFSPAYVEPMYKRFNKLFGK